MEDIKYMLKPEWVSWQDIKECMIKAHAPMRKKGIVMQNQTMTIKEFEEYFANTYCFVALKGKQVIGTSSYKIKNVNRWWVKGKVIYTCADAIIPEYKGTDVYLELQKLRMNYIQDSGIRVIMFDTEENNKLVQKLNIKKGAKKVKLYASSKTWYYSVVMVRWLDGCPFSDRYCNFQYKLSCFLIKALWKPGRIFRFWFAKDSDYQKVYNHYQLCSNDLTIEEFCQRVGVNYKRYSKWLDSKI